MKKLGLLITTVVSFIGLGFILASCGGGLPGSKYEKVAFAFKGVEKSFKDRATNSNNQLSLSHYQNMPYRNIFWHLQNADTSPSIRHFAVQKLTRPNNQLQRLVLYVEVDRFYPPLSS